MALCKRSILAAQDLPLEKVPCPEWGGDVFVRTLTAAERDAFEAGCSKTKKDGSREANVLNIRGRLAAKCICSEAGVRLFTDEDASDLGRKSSKVLDRIMDVARRLNGMLPDSVEDAKKNSENDPSEDSSSGSPAPSSDAPSGNSGNDSTQPS